MPLVVTDRMARRIRMLADYDTGAFGVSAPCRSYASATGPSPSSTKKGLLRRFRPRLREAAQQTPSTPEKLSTISPVQTVDHQPGWTRRSPPLSPPPPHGVLFRMIGWSLTGFFVAWWCFGTWE
jgi:hypothetical protein